MHASRLMLKSRLPRESLRFVLGGGFNTLLTYLIYWALLSWLDYGVAYTVSYVAGILTGFAINTWFVFRCPWSWKKLLAFPFIHLLSYVVAMLIVALQVHALGIPKQFAPFMATIVILPLSFALTRALIHKHKI